MSEVSRRRGIFVLGRHRSGTTWVSNILSAHDDVFTPQHPAHQGQHESAFFSHLVPYCRNGRSPEDRQAVRAIFERSDFWHLLFPEGGPELDIERIGVSAYFAACMSTAASRRGCSYWLEKTPAHTVFLPDLLADFPDSSFVAVERDRLEAVRSSVYRGRRDPGRIREWVLSALWGEMYRKIVALHRTRIFLLQYETLRRDPDGQTGALFAYLGLDPAGAGENTWAADSSFGAEAPRVPVRYRFVVQLVRFVFVPIPSRVCQFLARTWMRRKKKLPPWFFRVFQGRRHASGKQVGEGDHAG